MDTQERPNSFLKHNELGMPVTSAALQPSLMQKEKAPLRDPFSCGGWTQTYASASSLNASTGMHAHITFLSP